MKRRNFLVATVIIALVLGSIIYVIPTLLHPHTPSEATRTVEYGLQYFPYTFDSINNKLVADLQPQWFRVPAPYESRYPYPNHEKLMKAFANVDILMVIGPETMGAYEEGCTYSRSNASYPEPWMNARISSCSWSLQEWNANVSRLVEAFPNVHAWEVWNGPDFNEGGYLCCDDDVTILAHHYFDMLKDAYQIIKAHDPNDVVIAFSVELVAEGGVLSLAEQRTKDNRTKQFVENVWELGAANYCDAISFHANPHPGVYPLYSEKLEMFENLTGKPVWITQTGMSSNDTAKGETPESQATYLTQTFNFLSQYSYVKVVIWYYLYDPSDQYDYGLLTLAPVSLQTPKPAYYAFQSFTRKQTTT